MEAVRPQPAALKGLSRFLIEHETCGAGFDVSHPSGLGSGKVSMTCRGCGRTYEYATGTIEFEREIELEALAYAPPPAFAATASAPPDEVDTGELAVPVPLAIGAPPGAIPPPPPSAPLPPPAAPPGKRPPRSRDGSHRSRDRIVVAGLLVFAFLALGFAGIRLAEERDAESTAGSIAGTTAAPESESPPGPSEPAPEPQPAPAPPQQSGADERTGDAQTPPPGQKEGDAGPAQGKAGNGGATAPPAQGDQSQSDPAAAGQSATQPLAGERLVKTAHFSLIVPSGWTQHNEDGGLLLSAPNAAQASIWAFYENNPQMNRRTMATETGRFLRSRAPTGSLAAPTLLRIGGHPAFRLRLRSPAGTQAAVGILADPYRYLALEEVQAGAPAGERIAAERALRSFRPR